MTVEGEDAVKIEQNCIENKQSGTASSSSVSEGSFRVDQKSPGVCSPVIVSPSHRRTTGPIRRAKCGWTSQEDETLRNAVELYKGKSWKKIAEFFPERTEVQCLHRWQKVLNPELIKGPWTLEEDDRIVELVSKYGPTKWAAIARSLPGRIGKQCRERWHNHLNPLIKKDAWTPEEELVLMQAHQVHGNKWAEIAKALPGRTDNSIKNHWNSSLKKKLDFYLATGRLPPVPKISTQNGAKNIAKLAVGNLFVCSNNGLDVSPQTCSETVVSNHEDESTELHELEVDYKYRLESSTTLHSVKDASTSVPVNGPNTSDAIDCKPQASKIDHSCNKCASRLESGGRDSNDESEQDNRVTESPVHSAVPTIGSLYYELPGLENCNAPMNSSLLNTCCSMRQGFHLCTAMSPTNHSTVSFMKTTCSSDQSVESILKKAAESFQNTPSILRKRKRETCTPLPPSRIEQLGAVNINEGLCTPEEKERTGNNLEEFRSSNASSCESSACYGDGGKTINVSPPYRLRSKRNATLKSVEKQLEFTIDEKKFNANSKPMCSTIEGNFHDIDSDASVTRMHGGKLNDNIVGLEDVSSNCAPTTKMGVTY